MADVRRNDRMRRYELWDGDDRVGEAIYLDRGRGRIFLHTEMAEGHAGKGYGSQLLRAALDDARDEGLPVIPLCPFVERWIEQHDEYADLVDDEAMAFLAP